MMILALTALPAHAIDINNLPDWVRDSIHPVEIDWSQVYPGLAAPPAWAQEPAAVQEVHPGAGSPQAAGIGTLSTVSPAGPAGALNVAHPTTAATGGLQTASPASGLGGIGGLAPAHPSAAATAGLHEVNATPAAMTGLHEVKPGPSATAGLEPVSAGPIVGQINRLAPTDTRAQQLLLNWRTKAEYAGMVLGSVIKRDLLEQSIPPETMVGVLEAIPLAHPMDPVYLPVCETLWQRSGEKLDTCLALPYAPRIYMATYLGTIAREEDAKTLLSSLENPDKMTHGADLYHVACQLLDYERCSFPLAIWCHKRGATLRGPADQAFVCFHIRQACEKLGDPELVRKELIPWAEEALARPGGGIRLEYSVRELIWAYDYVGDHESAMARGGHWLERVALDLGPTKKLLQAQLELGEICYRAGKLVDAVRILTGVIEKASPDSYFARKAQAILLEQAGDVDMAGPHALLAPAFAGTTPERVSIELRRGEELLDVINVSGNPTFTVTAVRCSIPEITPFVATAETDSLAVKGIRTGLRVSPTAELGEQAGFLAFHTNASNAQEIRVPLAVCVGPAIVCRPQGTLSFAAVSPGATKTLVAFVSSTIPIEIVDWRAQPPGVVTLQTKRQRATSYLVQVTLSAPEQPGPIAGSLELRTNLSAEPMVVIRYEATVGEKH